jgi:hypothetical protein
MTCTPLSAGPKLCTQVSSFLWCPNVDRSNILITIQWSQEDSRSLVIRWTLINAIAPDHERTGTKLVRVHNDDNEVPLFLASC